MFVGSVHWLLNMATSLDDCRVSIFDCITEEVVWNSNNCDCIDIAFEVDYQGFGDYEICSYDIWTGADHKVHIEINIETE